MSLNAGFFIIGYGDTSAALWGCVKDLHFFINTKNISHFYFKIRIPTFQIVIDFMGFNIAL
jgi:hypothetical protein